MATPKIDASGRQTGKNIRGRKYANLTQLFPLSFMNRQHSAMQYEQKNYEDNEPLRLNSYEGFLVCTKWTFPLNFRFTRLLKFYSIVKHNPQ